MQTADYLKAIIDVVVVGVDPAPWVGQSTKATAYLIDFFMIQQGGAVAVAVVKTRESQMSPTFFMEWKQAQEFIAQYWAVRAESAGG